MPIKLYTSMLYFINMWISFVNLQKVTKWMIKSEFFHLVQYFELHEDTQTVLKVMLDL